MDRRKYYSYIFLGFLLMIFSFSWQIPVGSRIVNLEVAPILGFIAVFAGCFGLRNDNKKFRIAMWFAIVGFVCETVLPFSLAAVLNTTEYANTLQMFYDWAMSFSESGTLDPKIFLDLKQGIIASYNVAVIETVIAAIVSFVPEIGALLFIALGSKEILAAQNYREANKLYKDTKIYAILSSIGAVLLVVFIALILQLGIALCDFAYGDGVTPGEGVEFTSSFYAICAASGIITLLLAGIGIASFVYTIITLVDLNHVKNDIRDDRKNIYQEYREEKTEEEKKNDDFNNDDFFK